MTANSHVQSAISPLIDDSNGGPKDKHQLVYLIFVLLGTGVLIPYNTFITAGDFYGEIFAEKQPFEFWFSLANNIPCFATSLIMIRWGALMSNSWRLILSYAFYVAIVFVQPFIGIAMNNNQISVITARWLVIASVSLCGFWTGIVLPSVCGLAALFPPEYVQGAMSGVGLGGLIVAIIRVVTKAALPTDVTGVRIGSYIYFFVGAAVCLLCIAGYIMLLRVPYGQYNLKKATTSVVEKNSVNTPEEPLLDVPPQEEPAPTVSHLAVFKKMWLQAIMVVLTFFITLSLFPGVFSLIESTNNTLNTTKWMLIILVSIFLVFDFTGRTLPKFLVVFNARNVWIPGTLRLIFFPLFILMAKAVIHSDWIAYITSAIFAVSNGYLCSLTMMFGPEQVEEHEKEVAGIIMTFCLNIGIVSGVSFALAINAWVGVGS